MYINPIYSLFLSLDLEDDEAEDDEAEEAKSAVA